MGSFYVFLFSTTGIGIGENLSVFLADWEYYIFDQFIDTPVVYCLSTGVYPGVLGTRVYC